MTINTLSHPVGPLKGIGLFTGAPCTVTIAPAKPGEGVSVRRLGGERVPAVVTHVTADTSWSGLPKGIAVRNTTLAPQNAPAKSAAIATVEHLLSALAGLCIADASIEVDGPEIPIFDGSAAEFVRAFRRVLRDTHRPVQPLVLTREVRVEEGGASIVATPRPRRIGDPPLSYSYCVDYGAHSPIGAHVATWTGSMHDYEEQVAPARTFSLLKEAKAAQSLGLFKHLTPSDMLVIGDDGKPIDNEWRFLDEPARHKLLDLIGDLSLLGRPLYADVVATRSGHALTHRLCREILKSVE